MRHLTLALVIAGAALVVSGCGDSDSDEDASASAGAGIASVESVDGTDVLADRAGRTLYTAEVEKDGKIRCVKACTSFWAPVLASRDEAEAAAADLDADLGVVKRPEGKQQLTFNGLPLYTFTKEGPGQLKGDGFVDDFEGTHFEWESAKTESGSGSGGQGGGSGGGYSY